MTRKKSVRESQEDEPLSELPTASGQVKRFRGGSSQRERTRENDIETMPPPTLPAPITMPPALDDTPVKSTERPRTRSSSQDPAASHQRRRFDLSAALEIARSKDNEPKKPTPQIEVRDVHKEARRLIERSGGVPTPKPRLPMTCVPRRAMARREILRMPLDHRHGFVLAHIDGETNIRTIIDVCAMPEIEVCAVIERLLALRVIVLS